MYLSVLNPEEGGWSELHAMSCHPSNIYTMNVHVAWEHSSFKYVDLVAIQSSDPQIQLYQKEDGGVNKFPT